MTIQDGIRFSVNGGTTEINYRGYDCTAPSVLNTLENCESWLIENVLYSDAYLKHYADEYFSGDYDLVSHTGSGNDEIWDFGDVKIYRVFEWPKTEDGDAIESGKAWTLPNGLVAVKYG